VKWPWHDRRSRPLRRIPVIVSFLGRRGRIDIRADRCAGAGSGKAPLHWAR